MLENYPIPDLTDAETTRFWSHVNVAAKQDCWFWHRGYSKPGSRPLISIRGRLYVASRIMYKVVHSIDPGAMNVCHNCSPLPDDSRCVNAAHLWLGTDQDNILDAHSKGSKTGGCNVHGSRNGNSVLVESDIPEIQRAFLAGERRESIAKRYSVSNTTITKIVNGDSWTHMFDERLCLRQAKRKRHPNLQSEEIKAIKELLQVGSQTHGAIAAKFGVSRTVVCNIANDRCHANVS